MAYDQNIMIYSGALDTQCGKEFQMLQVCAQRRGPGGKSKDSVGIRVSVRTSENLDPFMAMFETDQLTSILKSAPRAPPLPRPDGATQERARAAGRRRVGPPHGVPPPPPPSKLDV